MNVISQPVRPLYTTCMCAMIFLLTLNVGWWACQYRMTMYFSYIGEKNKECIGFGCWAFSVCYFIKKAQAFSVMSHPMSSTHLSILAFGSLYSSIILGFNSAQWTQDIGSQGKLFPCTCLLSF